MGKGYRANAVVYWLHNWQKTFVSERGERNLYWAEIKADIVWSVRRCSEDARIAFRLYCLDGLEYCDIRYVTRWNNPRIASAIAELVDMTVDRLMDSDIYQGRRIEPPNPLPTLQDFDPGIPVRP